MDEIQRNSVFVSRDGGVLDFCDSDGQIVLSLPVPPGVQSANAYLGFVPPGGFIEVADGLVVVPPRGPALNPLSYGRGSHESGANPDFSPTSASHMERKLQLMVADLAAKSVEKSVTSRLAALQKMDVIPSNPDAAKPEAGSDGTGEVVE